MAKKTILLALVLTFFAPAAFAERSSISCAGLTEEEDIISFVRNLSENFGDTVVRPRFDEEIHLDILNVDRREGDVLCTLTYDKDRMDDFPVIIPKGFGDEHDVSPPVHQWLAYQAKFLWTKPEISSFLPRDWTDDISSLDGSKILYGVRMEDQEIDMDAYAKCSILYIGGGRPYCQHFWDEDAGPNAGLYLNKQWDSGYQRSQKLWDKKVIPYYNAGKKKEAYYWLGRVAHMLGDLGVPAHAHLDMHIFVDTYEMFMGDRTLNTAGNYRQWSASGAPAPGTTLFEIFQGMADLTDDFESNDRDGEHPTHKEGHKRKCETQKTRIGHLWGCYDVSKKEAVRHGNVLMPAAMQHIAGLYRLFWQSTSDPQCPGPGCDEYDHYSPGNYGGLRASSVGD